MKSRYLKTALSILFFLILIAFFAVVSRPIYKSITYALESYEVKYLNLLSDKTGLSLRYESLSPSILTGIRFKNVDVYEKDNGTSILKIRKITVRYDFMKLIHKDFENAFTKIIINDVTFSYDNMENSSVANHLKEISKSENTLKRETNISDKASKKINPMDFMYSVKDIIFMLPQDILVRNFNGSFSYGDYDVKAMLESVSFVRDKDSDSIATSISGWAVSAVPFLDGKTAGFTFDVNAHIFERFEDSSIFLTLNDYSPSEYSIRRMEFLIRYSDRNILLSSIQQVIPYNLNISYGFDTRCVNIDVSTQDLDPFSMVKLPKISDSISKIKGTRITVDGGITFNFEDFSYSWNTMGSSSLSRNITPDGEWINFSVNGNNNRIVIDQLKAWGNKVQASLYGSLDLETMKPELNLFLDHYTMYNGNRLSLDAYLDTNKETYTVFIPQFTIAEKSFTALQLDAVKNGESWSFTFESSDYDHLLNDAPGKITIEGDLLLGHSNYLEAIVHVQNEFGKAIFDTISYLCSSPDTISNLRSLGRYFEEFVVSTDVYLSSNLHSVTYNAPYVIVANTLVEKQMAIVSLDGTNFDLNFSQVDLIYGMFSLQGKGNYSYFRDVHQHTFGVDATVNSIPYSLNGSYFSGDWLNITGDFGLDIAINFENNYSGSVSLGTMPLMLNNYLFYVGTNFIFDIERKSVPFMQKKFSFNILNLEVQESSKIEFEPKISCVGEINNSGIFLSSLAYSDLQSSLSGEGNATWNTMEGVLANVQGIINIANPVSKEKVYLEASYVQQDTIDGLDSGKYIDFFADVTGLNMGRFMNGQNEDDVLNAKFNATGSLKNPSVVLDIGRLTINIAGSPMNIKGDINLDMIDDNEWNLNASNLGVDWKGAYLSGMQGSLEIVSFEGLMNGTLGASFLQKEMSMPVTVSVTTLEKGSGFIPDSFMVVTTSSGINEKLYEVQVPVYLEVIKAPSVLMVRSDENLGVSGYYMMDSGNIQASVLEEKPFHFNLEGNLNSISNTFDLFVDSFYFDSSKFSKFINTSFFSVHSGIVEGDINISGLQTDPEFHGSLNVTEFDFNLPDYVKDHFKMEDSIVTLSGNEIVLPDSNVISKDSGAIISANVLMDRWKLDTIDVKFKTVGEKGIPVDTKYSLLRVKGRFAADLSLVLQDKVVGLIGDVIASDTEISVLDNSSFMGTEKENKKEEKNEDSGRIGWGIQANLNLSIGQKVQFVINPIMRGMVAPGTNVSVGLDTANALWNVKGDVALRGGEISYLSRNFYLKEGRVLLDENQNNFDPMLTVRAETRERDNDGENITIVLSAVRQRLSVFSPTLYANPAKSEAEIYELLGQLAVADSSSVSGLLIAGMDYGVQVTVIRKIEGALRDLFNFDIFSLRSSVFQNAIKQGLNIDSEKNTSFGNYFDNTTVYIGKYIGSSVYMDAMLLWTYDATAYETGKSKTGIIFNLDMGIEFAAPFADIRWSFAPDLGSLQETLVSGTSITFTWRKNF